MIYSKSLVLKQVQKLALLFFVLGQGFSSFALASSPLSPENWPGVEKARLEKLELDGWAPSQPRSVEGSGGIISATVSPVAVYAGMQALRAGGTAADAAAATALTQVTRELGSVVSYAGIFTMVYYDAQTKRVYAMDAGYNSYRGETEPTTIPVGDLGAMKFGRDPSVGGAKGRETLVPGFMAGLEAMHRRFGRLDFRDLFQPAIWYSENGVKISPTLSSFFEMRGTQLSRTPEGRKFLRQSSREKPIVGDLFVQPDLATTLKGVAENGARYMYTGAWAKEFVSIVQREGGKVDAADLERYQATWSTPYETTVFGHTLYTNGSPHLGAFGLFAGLHLAEARQLNKKGPYWTDPEAFQELTRINLFVANAPLIDPISAALLSDKKIDFSPAAQLGKPFAEAIAPFLGQMSAAPADNGPHHSNSIVVVDKNGNIAAITHTINAVVWGDTGIVIGGIPLPDSAAFQQTVLAAIKPGDRVPHTIIDTITLAGETPVLATASIGPGLLPETMRVVLGVVGKQQALSEIMAAPALLPSFEATEAVKPLPQRYIPIPAGEYSADFLAKVKARGILLREIPAATATTLRGVVAAVRIDEKSGNRTAGEQPGVMIYSASD